MSAEELSDEQRRKICFYLLGMPTTTRESDLQANLDRLREAIAEHEKAKKEESTRWYYPYTSIDEKLWEMLK